MGPGDGRFFVKEFRRRREQRRWSALISNMLPPAVVHLLQREQTERSSVADVNAAAPAAAAPAAPAASLASRASLDFLFLI